MSDRPEEIKISVALVTRNRPEMLDRCLESLRSQSLQPFEVIVSDDSDPEVAVETERVAKHWNCQYIKGPRRGLQANLNHAVSACQGTHIRTMNDDHIFPQDHFKIIQNVVESDPKSIWTLGEYCESPGTTPVFHLPGEIQPRGFHKPIEKFDDCLGISGGASIFPKQIFEKHRFLETFGYVCDLELGPRLKGLGYQIRYCSETHIIHLSHGISREQKLRHKGEFLMAYLTYSCYLKNLPKEIECLSYFLAIALLTSLKIKDFSFGLLDFRETWEIGKKYQKLFQSGCYEQIV